MKDRWGSQCVGRRVKEKGGHRRVKRTGTRTEIERCKETSLGFSTYQDTEKPFNFNGWAKQRRSSRRKTQETEVKRSSSRKEVKESPPSGRSPAVWKCLQSLSPCAHVSAGASCPWLALLWESINCILGSQHGGVRGFGGPPYGGISAGGISICSPTARRSVEAATAATQEDKRGSERPHLVVQSPTNVCLSLSNVSWKEEKEVENKSEPYCKELYSVSTNPVYCCCTCTMQLPPPPPPPLPLFLLSSWTSWDQSSSPRARTHSSVISVSSST